MPGLPVPRMALTAAHASVTGHYTTHSIRANGWEGRNMKAHGGLRGLVGSKIGHVPIRGGGDINIKRGHNPAPKGLMYRYMRGHMRDHLLDGRLLIVRVPYVHVFVIYMQTGRLLREQKHNLGACLSRQRYLPTNPKNRVQNWTDLGPPSS